MVFLFFFLSQTQQLSCRVAELFSFIRHQAASLRQCQAELVAKLSSAFSKGSKMFKERNALSQAEQRAQRIARQSPYGIVTARKKQMY